MSTLKRFRKGQRVRLVDPVRIAQRFWREDWRAIVGAGQSTIPREAMDGLAFVFDVAAGGRRGLVEFGHPGSNVAMWLDPETCVSVARCRMSAHTPDRPMDYPDHPLDYVLSRGEDASEWSRHATMREAREEAETLSGPVQIWYADRYDDDRTSAGQAPPLWERVTQYTICEATPEDGGLQIIRLSAGEDCCEAARRAGAICHHGAEGERPLGDGASLAQCRAALAKAGA